MEKTVRILLSGAFLIGAFGILYMAYDLPAPGSYYYYAGAFMVLVVSLGTLLDRRWSRYAWALSLSYYFVSRLAAFGIPLVTIHLQMEHAIEAYAVLILPVAIGVALLRIMPA